MQGFAYDFNNARRPTLDLVNGSGIYYQGLPAYRVWVPGPCCVQPTNKAKGNFRNLALIAALDIKDSEWRQYVGWIQFYNVTAVYGAHVDAGGDCTHVSWSPFHLDTLWVDMANEHRRLHSLL
jgi:hypothetical protein